MFIMPLIVAPKQKDRGKPPAPCVARGLPRVGCERLTHEMREAL